MAKAKLNPRNVATLKAPSEGRAVYFDQAKGAPAGFALRVSGESRVYYVTYRLRGRFTWYKVGKADKLSLSKARGEARRVLARVELGHDPQAEREETIAKAKAAKAAGTFSSLCDDWLTVRRPDLRSKTVTYYEWLVSTKVDDTPLGRMKAEAVTPADLERRLSEVRAKAGGVTANRLHQVLTTVCRWARKRGKLAVNAMEQVDRPLQKEQTRERVLTDAEVSCLLAALEGEEAARAATVRLLLMLGQRSTATMEGLRWDGLDLQASIPTWTIPGAFQKKGRLHVVPLPEQAVAIIDAMRPVTGSSERVLGDVDSANYERWWGPIRDRALAVAAKRDLKMEHFTRHDLRRTAMTGMTKLGVTRFLAQRVIGHAEQGVGGVYDRNDYLRDKAGALATWARHLEHIETGQERRADVRAFNRA